MIGLLIDIGKSCISQGRNKGSAPPHILMNFRPREANTIHTGHSSSPNRYFKAWMKRDGDIFLK